MSSKFDIEHIATLARLRLGGAEKERLGRQLLQIVEYINQLDELDTADVEPTSHVLPLHNVFRDDDAPKAFTPADYLQGAPRKDKGHYEVPQIIG